MLDKLPKSASLIRVTNRVQKVWQQQKGIFIHDLGMHGHGHEGNTSCFNCSCTVCLWRAMNVLVAASEKPNVTKISSPAPCLPAQRDAR